MVFVGTRYAKSAIVPGRLTTKVMFLLEARSALNVWKSDNSARTKSNDSYEPWNGGLIGVQVALAAVSGRILGTRLMAELY